MGPRTTDVSGPHPCGLGIPVAIAACYPRGTMPESNLAVNDRKYKKCHAA